MIFIVVGVILVIGVIAVIGESAKKAKQNKQKQDAERAMNLLDGKDEFKKFLDYDNSSKPVSHSQQPTNFSQPQRTAQSTQSASPSHNSTANRQMMTELQQRLVELKRNQALRNEVKAKEVVVTSSHHDNHCDVSHHESKDKYRVEYVPTMHSIGGKSTEGCEDSYNLRYVKLDEDEAKKLELTPLQKAIVYGEILNEPAFKRGYRTNRLR